MLLIYSDEANLGRWRAGTVLPGIDPAGARVTLRRAVPGNFAASTGRDCDLRASARREAARDRWAVCRDPGTAWRVLPGGRSRFGRGYRNCRADPCCA